VGLWLGHGYQACRELPQDQWQEQIVVRRCADHRQNQ